MAAYLRADLFDCVFDPFLFPKKLRSFMLPSAASRFSQPDRISPQQFELTEEPGGPDSLPGGGGSLGQNGEG